jgi:predicted permease
MARLPINEPRADPWALAWVPVLGLLVALLALLLNHVLLALPMLRPDNEAERRALDMMAPWSNTVIVGLPTVATLLGPELLYVPFLESSFVWTLALGPLIIRGAANRQLLWQSVRPLLRSTWFWAIPVGLIWAVLRLPLGGVGLTILERAREAFLALGLLVVGIGFDPARLRPHNVRRLPRASIAISGVIKLLICPLLALLLALPLALPPGVPAAFALTVATPPSLTAYIISEREGVDPEFMSFVFALYGLLFFVTILIVRGLLLPALAR